MIVLIYFANISKSKALNSQSFYPFDFEFCGRYSLDHFAFCNGCLMTKLHLAHCILYVTQHIERYQFSEDWILSYGDVKSKYLKI